MATDLSCSLINTITIDCSGNTGGLIEIKLKKLPSTTTYASDYSVTSGAVTIAPSSKSGWKTWSLVRETSSLKEMYTSNVANGTSAANQELQIIVNKMRAALRNEMEVFMMNIFVQAAVRDNNDNCWLLGAQRGLKLNDGEGASGAAFLDRNGYVLTFKGGEPVPAYTITLAQYQALYDA